MKVQTMEYSIRGISRPGVEAGLQGFGQFLRMVVLAMGLGLLTAPLQAQNERKAIREGVRAYEEGDYGNAEVEFRKAQELDGSSFEADFNTGTALYGQEKYEESLKHYQSLLEKQQAASSDPSREAQIWHNMGNSLLEGQKYAESIEAYKNSLRLNPADGDSRYNLAYARQKLQEQQQQQQQEQNQDQQDQNQDQQNQDQQNQEEQQNQQDQENQDQQDQQDQDQQQDQQQQQPMNISPEDAERMLQAIQAQEKDVKEKVDKKKAAATRVKNEKDW